MPQFLIRILTVLLVPCLITEPALSSALGDSSRHVIPYHSAFYSVQALAQPTVGDRLGFSRVFEARSIQGMANGGVIGTPLSWLYDRLYDIAMRRWGYSEASRNKNIEEFIAPCIEGIAFGFSVAVVSIVPLIRHLYFPAMTHPLTSIDIDGCRGQRRRLCLTADP
jgi:hypothetical protein